MTTSEPLLSKPTFQSLHSVSGRAPYIEDIVRNVREYYRERWPWTSPEQREEYLQQDIELWGVLVCPRAPRERAELASAWVAFFFIYDDLLEAMGTAEGKASVASLKKVMLDSQPPRNAIEEIMHDLCTRILSFGDHHSRKLAREIFVETCRYMDATGNQAARHRSMERGFENYLQYRIVEGGYWFTFKLFSWELDLADTPEHLLADPEFASLTALAGGHEMLINDMYSYRWEAKLLARETQKITPTYNADDSRVEDGYILYNAVCLLLQQDGVNEFNVLDRLSDYIRKNELEFLSTADSLRKRYANEANDLAVIDLWASVLVDFMAGSHVWSTVCRRYNF